NGHTNIARGETTTTRHKPPALWAQTKLRLESQGYREIAVYEYLGANGALLAEKLRFERINLETGEREKQFRWRRRGSRGELVTGGIEKGTSTPPYGLARLLEQAEVTVFVLEGEKEVDNFNNLGLPGVAISIEVGHEEEAAQYLHRRTVFVVPD